MAKRPASIKFSEDELNRLESHEAYTLEECHQEALLDLSHDRFVIKQRRDGAALRRKKRGRALARYRFLKGMYELALTGNAAAIKLWSKREGMDDTQTIELKGGIDVALTRLSNEELDARIERLISELVGTEKDDP
jgi:hypothetical protein